MKCATCGVELPNPPPEICPQCRTERPRAVPKTWGITPQPKAKLKFSGGKPLAIVVGAVVALAAAVSLATVLTRNSTAGLSTQEKAFVADVRRDVGKDNLNGKSPRELVDIGNRICNIYRISPNGDVANATVVDRADSFGVNGVSLVAGTALKDLCPEADKP